MEHCIEAAIIKGQYKGHNVFIPRFPKKTTTAALVEHIVSPSTFILNKNTIVI